MKHGPPLGAFLVARLHNATGKRFAQILKESRQSALDASAASVIFAIWQNGSASIQEIAEQTGFRRSTLSCILNRLEESHWIKRVQSPDDRRKITIRLLKSADDIRTSFGAILETLSAIYYVGFTDQDSQAFEAYAQRVLRNLETQDSSGPYRNK